MNKDARSGSSPIPNITRAEDFPPLSSVRYIGIGLTRFKAQVSLSQNITFLISTI